MAVWNDLYEESKCVKVCHHLLSCLVAVHACILAAQLIDGCIIVQYIYLLKVVTLSNLEIVRVMGRCNLYTACSELLVNIWICDNRDLSVCKWQLQHLSNYICVSLIIRIYSNSCISEKCLRSCGCYLNKSSRLSNYRIVDVPEISVLLLMDNLCIRYGSLTYRTPVDDP